MMRIFAILSFCLVLQGGHTKAPPYPIIVTPPLLRLNATNTIFITPVHRNDGSLADIRVQVHELLKNGNRQTEYRQARGKSTGHAHPISFKVQGDATEANITVTVTDHTDQQIRLLVTPDLRTIHLKTDKGFYKAGETINVRAVPITINGEIYTGPIEYALVNPDGFELTKHEASALNGPLALTFELPEHLFYGQWQIKARPVNFQNQPLLNFAAVFQVTDYVLPPFVLDFQILDGDSPAETRVTASAHYFHGGLVSGSVTLNCFDPDSQAPYEKQLHQPIIVGEIKNGKWSSVVNIRRCLQGQSSSTDLFLEVRDQGTGKKGTASIRHDPNSTGFQIVPLKPAYTRYTTRLYLASVQDPNHSATDGELEVRCVANERTLRGQVLAMAVRVGDTMTVDLPESWSEKCYVIRLKWTRKMNRGGNSRERLMVIPKADMVPKKAELNLALLQPVNYSSQYTVGEQIAARANVNDDSYNYVTICNGKDLVRSARVEPNRLITFPATRKMLGNCVLYLYSTRTSQVDMLLFFVNDRCSGSTIPSQDSLKPGQKVVITMNGQKNGYVIMRTLDEKIAKLMKEDQQPLPKLWEGLFFARNFQKEEQIRMFNLITLKDVNNIITQNCFNAGPFFGDKSLGGVCPEGKASTSAVSDLCMQQITMNCRPGGASAEPICDRTGPSGCRYETSESEEDYLPTQATGDNVFESDEEFFNANIFQKGKSGYPPGIAVGSSGPSEYSAPAPTVPPDDGAIFTGGRPLMLMDDFELEPPILPADEVAITRSYFPHVWIFDDFQLGPTGTVTTRKEAPHSVGRWVIQTDYWAPSEFSFCTAMPKYITSSKSFFMEVDMPKNVYVNESITVKISVTATDLDEERQLSICYGNMPRQLCADMGPSGTHGLPAYSRIVLNRDNPITTKTFNMRFFKTGDIKIIFTLRTEVYVPGDENRCSNGEVLDSIEQPIMIAKRAETEEHYRRLILSIEKPVSKSLYDAVEEVDRSDTINPNILDVLEYRSPHEDALISEIHSNIADTDSVYSITAEISKFLPIVKTPFQMSNEVPDSGNSRKKRGIMDYGNTFLSDVLKKLSFELYQFKLEKSILRKNDANTELLENSIGSLIADMLRFSDCSSNTSCGYYEYGRPAYESQRSPVLTAMSTSLLCEAIADEKLVCGSIRYLQEVMVQDFSENDSNQFINFNGLADIDAADRAWFLRGMLLQIAQDCAAYTCVKNDEAWSRLYEFFYDFEEHALTDMRAVAALAYMATNATNHVLRQKLNASIRENVFPYWEAGRRSRNVLDRLQNGQQNFFNLKGIKSGDVLVNALGILAFVGRSVDILRLMDFDSLADWIYEQKKEDGTYENALDTYFASRALYEYRWRKVDISPPNENLIVEISAPGFGKRIINVTDTSMLIYFPTNVRNITIKTRGFGKVKAGIRLLAAKRQRSRRELSETIYPIRMTVDQAKQNRDIILQTVCLTSLSPLIDTFEVVHGLFTGFTTHFDKVQISEQSDLKLINLPMVSSYAVHMTVQLNKTNVQGCYKVALFPPDHPHEPAALAPVEISCRHPVNDIVGQVLISHPDAVISHRTKRGTSVQAVLRHMRKPDVQHAAKRKTRAVIDETIESVCFNGGQCTCGESTCAVRCNSCQRSTALTVRKEICRDGVFGIFGDLIQKRQSTVSIGTSAATYDIYKMRVYKTLMRDETIQLRNNEIEIWLRTCNQRCSVGTSINRGESYFVIGDKNDIIVDADARTNYVLRLTDRFEKSTEACVHYQNVFWSGPFNYTTCDVTRR